MRKVIILITELLFVTAALFIADYWQESANVIPRSLIHLPQVDYTPAEFWQILKIFLGLHLIAILLMQLKAGVWIMSNAQRSINELFLLIATYSISALTVFLATTINFDPDFMAGIGICIVMLSLIAHIGASFVKGTQLLSLLTKLCTTLFKRLFSVVGLLVLVLALTPAVMAYFFTKDRDFANIVTQMRINISGFFSAELNYSLVSVTGDYRFHQPMLARMAPGDNKTLYVLERAGRILKLPYPLPTSTQPEEIMNLKDKVGYVEVENGTLGFTFHPEFGTPDSDNSGFVYLYYTDVRDDTQVNRISRFNLNAGSTTAIIESETPLLILNREASGFHNGGSLEFGPDGFLYIALGEGIHLKERSQAQTLRQGIIRIDVDMQGGDISHPVTASPTNGKAANYYIPNDNPFTGRADIREEYWAIGLRNPFRISFDQETGNLWAGDVGSTEWEEVNRITKGGNYQYPYAEGFVVNAAKKPATLIGKEVEPVYTYLHTAYDRAVIGGIVYRNGDLSNLTGNYIFADNYSSKLFVMPTNESRVETVQEIARASQYAQRGVSSVSQLPNGDVLITTLGRASAASGEILKLTDSELVKEKDISSSNTAEPVTVSAADAEEIFVTNCSRCHGETGQANGPDSKLLGVDIADFSKSEFQNKRSDDDLLKIISKGGNEAGLSPFMPPWEGILDEQEINALVGHIRGLAVQNKKAQE
jgi:glucose/arabinose dehydrogenase